jgi:hypothetical protein
MWRLCHTRRGFRARPPITEPNNIEEASREHRQHNKRSERAIAGLARVMVPAEKYCARPINGQSTAVLHPYASRATRRR